MSVTRGDGTLFWTGGMQLAAQAAIGDGEPLLLLLNDDVELAPGAIATLLRDAMSTKLPGQAPPSVIAGTLLDRTSGVVTYGGVIRTSAWDPLRFRSIGACGVPFRCATMNGNVVLIASQWWSLVSGLDIGLPHRAADFDLGLRLGKLGIHVYQSSEAVGWAKRNPHRAGQEPSLALRQRISRAFGTKGNPPGALMTYVFRHAGWPAPLIVAKEMLGTGLGALRSHFKREGARCRENTANSEFRLAYCLDFVPSPTSGKHRATLHKIAALHRQGVKVTALPPRSAGGFYRLLDAPLSEIRAAAVAWGMPRGASAFVGRGFCGIAGQIIARARGIPTVREIHGLANEEVVALGRPRWWRLLHAPLFAISSALDRTADVRIYNNPSLYRALERRQGRGLSIVIPNGCEPAEQVRLGMREARKYFGLPSDKLVLAFVGSASPWHGIDRLQALQRAFDEGQIPISIVAGGGPIDGLAPNGRSISPLASSDCGRLIRASNACLLPSGGIRTSPGSPLKLYDYLLNGRAVIVQDGLEGYGDQVVPKGVGLAVDFHAPHETARAIHEYLQSLDFDAMERRCERLALGDYSWDSRVRCWLRAIRAMQG